MTAIMVTAKARTRRRTATPAPITAVTTQEPNTHGPEVVALTWHESPNITLLSNVLLRSSSIFPGPVPALWIMIMIITIIKIKIIIIHCSNDKKYHMTSHVRLTSLQINEKKWKAASIECCVSKYPLLEIFIITVAGPGGLGQRGTPHPFLPSSQISLHQLGQDGGVYPANSSCTQTASNTGQTRELV